MSPLEGPAVWRGSEMARRDEWRTDLEPRHVAELRAATDDVADCELASIDRESFPLPTLGPVLTEVLGDIVGGRGFALLRGVPVDGLDEPQLERLFWGLGTHLGIGIPQNDAGDLLVHVRDQGRDFSNPEVRAYETAARLDYHSDSADVVGLLCVRPAREGGVSTIVSAAAVYNEAHRRRPDLAGVLGDQWWWDRRKPDLTTTFFQRRIFAVADGDLVSYYGRAHIESATRGEHVPPLTDERIEALDLLDDVANDPAFVLNMSFQPGDMQFLNNYRIWHARPEYVDFPEPQRRRDLLRLWLTLREHITLPGDFATGGITDRTAAFT